MRLYGELAPWFHLLTAPADYAGEAARYERLILTSVPDATTLPSSAPAVATTLRTSNGASPAR